jgi:hypothetical protein
MAEGQSPIVRGWYTSVRTDDRGVEWFIKDTKHNRVICRSPKRYKTLDEANESLDIFIGVMDD